MAKKSILLSALSVGVAVLMLGYSAFGWFAMSRETRATALNVEVTAPNNLQISKDGTNFYDSVNIDLNEVVAAMPGNTEYDAEADSFFLNPASSFNGLSMWYTETADINGFATCAADAYNLDSTYPTTVHYRTDSKKYEGHYIDVDLWFKNSSTDLTDVYLLKDFTDITSTDSEDIVKVVRAAFLNDDATAIAYTGNTGYTDALVYEKPGLMHTTTNVVTTNGSVSQLVTPKYIGFGEKFSNQSVFQLSKQNSTDKYASAKITVRIWIEGQDNKCIGQIGGMSFSLKLGFGLLNE